MDQDLAARISDAWNNHADKNTVAFIGRPKSGKTVATALLKYTLTEYWDPKRTGIHGSVIKGNDYLNEILGDMRNGDYPGVTPRREKPEVRIKLRNIKGNTADWMVVINDMSGEDVIALLSTDKYNTAEERIGKILEINMPHLLFASKYVILVDCEGKDSWGWDGDGVASAVNNLVELKKTLPDECPSKFSVAVMFTKADTLPPKQKNLVAKDILGLYRELSSNLDMNKISYVTFKSHIKTIKPRKTDKTVPDDGKNDAKHDTWKAQMALAIKSETENEVAEARNSGIGEDEIAKIPDAVRSRVEKQFAEQMAIDAGIGSTGVDKPRVKYPFDYSDASYSNLISWLVNSDGDSL